MTTDIHSCGPFCKRPECVAAQQPEALRLADWAEVQANREANEEEDNLNAISAELRRLHAEVEKLRQGGGAVYQYKRGDGSWIDQTKTSYDYNVAYGAAEVRVLFNHPQQQAAPHPIAHEIAQEQAKTDQTARPEYLAWLRSLCPERNGVGGNEAWNAGVAWQAAQASPPLQARGLVTAETIEDTFSSLREAVQTLADVQEPGIKRVFISTMLAQLSLLRRLYASQPLQADAKVPQGWKLARAVLQSDLYNQLDDEDRAICDAMLSASPAAPTQVDTNKEQP